MRNFGLKALETQTLVDPRGRVLEMRLPLCPILSFSCSFLQNLAKQKVGVRASTNMSLPSKIKLKIR